MNQPIDDSSALTLVTASASGSRGGILSQIDLTAAPFCGEIFSSEAISQGYDLMIRGLIRVITSNERDGFAGIFGQAINPESAITTDVTIIVRHGSDGWSVDGSSGHDGGFNGVSVAAVLMAAILKSGGHVDLSKSDPGKGTDPGKGAKIVLRKHDIRADSYVIANSESGLLLENFAIIQIDMVAPEVEERLREMGLRRVIDLYSPDRILPEYHQHLAFSSLRRVEQETFWTEFLTNGRKEIEALGCSVQIEADFNLRVIEPTEYYGELLEEDGVDWFGFEYGIRVSDEKINLLPCLVRFLESQSGGISLDSLGGSDPTRCIPIPLENSGEFVAIPAGKLQTILGLISELFDSHSLTGKGTLRLHPLRAAQLTACSGDDALVDDAPESLRRRAEELAILRPEADSAVPQGFLAILRPYQQDGVEWLQFLREQELGGILADDMGLGKTVQTLCLLHHEKHSGRSNRASLILAPKSVVSNWAKEAKKFAPSLRVIVLQGGQRKKYYSVLNYCDLVITSYPVLLRDAEELLAQKFHYVVLDEAHTIKNTSSQITKVAWKLDARHRLCLSGTPIENHLGELWSQFHFLVPGFLGTEESFTRCFRRPIEKFRDEALRQRLVERVAPLMLRRTKACVADDLPEKTIIVRSVELHPAQIELYEAVRAAVSRDIHEEISRLGFERSKLLVLDALLKLRQVCNHPRLLKLPSAQKVNSSAKLELFLEWVPTMVSEGRRILVFSQFTQMLALIEQELTRKGVRFLTLTGETKDRGRQCDDFQNGKAPVFLISLRAGGTGLNLTAADTVIHFDPWWNPALEAQATDRAYRIGQKNPVFVYKLITEGTIEEKIVMLQHKKQALFEGILEGAPQKLSFSEADIDDLLAPIA